MPSIVILVAAIFVARTTFLIPFGGGSKILRWSSRSRALYIGIGNNPFMASSSSTAVSISCLPVRNTNMSPGASVSCISCTFAIAACRYVCFNCARNMFGVNTISTLKLRPGIRNVGLLCVRSYQASITEALPSIEVIGKLVSIDRCTHDDDFDIVHCNSLFQETKENICIET